MKMKRIAVCLRNEVVRENKRRTDLAHGDWWIGFGEKPDGAMADPKLSRIRPGRKEGAVKFMDLPAHEIDEISDTIYALRQKVSEFGDLCLESVIVEMVWGKPVRVRDIFRFHKRENRVTRDGPMAAERKVKYS